MNRNITDINLAADAKDAIRFWEEHPDLKLQEATCAQFKKAETAYEAVAESTMQKEAELRLEIAERARLAREVRTLTTRVRSAVRGVYGPDSKEYEQVGGKRVSTHKRPLRRNRGRADVINADDNNAVMGNGNGNGNGSRSIAMVH